MTKEEFYAELKNILQTNHEIDGATNLADLEEWDSLGIISIVSFWDQKYKVKTDYASLTRCSTASDLYQKVFPNE